jgi:hypothetical protein
MPFSQGLVHGLHAAEDKHLIDWILVILNRVEAASDAFENPIHDIPRVQQRLLALVDHGKLYVDALTLFQLFDNASEIGSEADPHGFFFPGLDIWAGWKLKADFHHEQIWTALHTEQA